MNMEATDRLSKIYGALAHPVRRAILAQLARGEAKVSDISTRFDMSGPAITNHLKVLEKADIVLRAVFAARGRGMDEHHAAVLAAEFRPP
jgi:DNA-binding transcriptional ArsR family regulator